MSCHDLRTNCHGASFLYAIHSLFLPMHRTQPQFIPVNTQFVASLAIFGVIED